jgi:Na+/H+-dicarboxylate symporter
MAPALDAIGVPVAGLALMLGIDRIPDMMRSVVNVVGHVTAAVMIDRQNSGPK